MIDEDEYEEVVLVPANPPLIALLPHIFLHALIIFATHFMVVYNFARSSTQAAVVKNINAYFPTVGQNLYRIEVRDIHFWGAVPFYFFGCLLFRFSVSLVIGRGLRSRIFSTNVTRIISAIAFILSLLAQNHYHVWGNYESLNALFALRFGFILQEFLLNFSRFTYVRCVYSILSMMTTGYLSYNAYMIEKFGGDATGVAPALVIALSWALSIAQASNNLSAIASLCHCLGLSPVYKTIPLALQVIVNFAVVPILSVSLYARNPALFNPTSLIYQPTNFMESSVASFLMVTLVFLLIIDSYLAPIESQPTMEDSHKTKVKKQPTI